MDNKNLDNLRHSAAHLLAAAVIQIWPDSKRTIGPAIENGFYFDFDFGDIKISENDFSRIEQKMHEIAKTWVEFTRYEKSPEDAKKEYPGNEYKHELIDTFAKDGQKISFYQAGEYSDLCEGGHVEDPKKELKHFKLLSIAGAYWHGDEKNKMLTRVYGTIWPTKEELQQYLLQLEEAKKRDHRKLGADLGLFVFSDLVGKGLPMFTAKGATLKRILERFIVDEEIKRGYQHVITPPIAKVDLYRMSGHYPYYKETMYPPMIVDNEELILRPMTCPHHFMLYKSSPHSYKELPIRLAEISPQFRYEKSGELTGLIRLRMFMLADAHIICSKEQAKQEIKQVLKLIDYVNSALGLKKGVDYRYRLSLGERKDSKKYYKDDNSWDQAEQVLREVLIETKAPYYEAQNEAAFYGPKIDVQMKNVNGKEDTAFTVQYDFVMPKRFSLTYIDENGLEKEPIVIHRASLGCFERTMAFLIEHYKGAFPLWLNPVQVEVLTISEKHNDYAKKVTDILLKNNIRAHLNDENATIGKKIRQSTLQKVSFMIIIGDKEIEKSQDKETQYVISLRSREGENRNQILLYDFISELKSTIEKYL